MAPSKKKASNKSTISWSSLISGEMNSPSSPQSPSSFTEPSLPAPPASVSPSTSYKSHTSKAATAMDDFDNPERVKYLSVIDKIRETGVTKDISLPQLVVVGDQSSGKSSLLEGITGLAFPVAGDVCTRFATQIILKRCPPEQASAVISIIPSATSAGDDAAKKHLESFRRSIDASMFEKGALGDILNEASRHLGLPDPTAQLDEGIIPENRFSDDIVRIELSGPDQRHLSVVDVPGLFHNPTLLQTARDKETIRNLVQGYVNDKRTIILGVCNALSNLASQEVFQLARDADPNGQRTVGIVTKCDAVESGDEHNVLKIATNKYQPLKHGWFVVKNRSTKDINDGVTVEQRHINERTFFDSTQPWNSISKNRRGVGPLKDYLGQLLSDHTRAEFPGMIADLKERREESLKALHQLGDARQNSAEQRRFLADLATKYEKRVQDVLGGTYDKTTRATPALKLRKVLRDLDDSFNKEMLTKGHTYIFRTVEDKIDPDYDRDMTDVDLAERGDIYGWIRELYLDNRGVELPGMVNPSIVRIAYQEQSASWEDLAQGYFRKTVLAINAFRKNLLDLLVTDADVKRNLQAHLELGSEAQFDKAEERLQQCIADERDNVLKTVNDYYTQTLDKCRTDRIIKRLKDTGLFDDPDEDHQNGLDFQAILQAAQLTNEEEAVNNIHDALKAYYKVSIKRFIDGVLMGTVESNLLGEDGPVQCFNPRMVNTLSDEQLSAIAAETSMTSTARSEATAKAERLQQALDMAKSIGV